MENTLEWGRQGHTAPNLEACQDACFNIASCVGVEWNPGQQIGGQCLLNGLWTPSRYRSPRQVSVPGSTQYLLNRTYCGKSQYHPIWYKDTNMHGPKQLTESQLQVRPTCDGKYLSEFNINCFSDRWNTSSSSASAIFRRPAARWLLQEQELNSHGGHSQSQLHTPAHNIPSDIRSCHTG